VGLDPDGKPLPGNTDRRYLKAANRAFSYLRTIGDIEGMDQLKPVYGTSYLQMNQRQQMLELLADRALDPKFPSRIITAAKAKEQVEGAATTLEPLGSDFSTRLRNIAAQFRGRGVDPLDLTQPLQTDAALAATLETLINEISDALDAAVAGQVKPVVDRYVLPFANFPPQFPPRLVSISRDTSSFFISWEPSFAVDVQKRSSLLEGTWTAVATNVTSVTFYETLSPGENRAFYRLLKRP
jgi:hypothetical protein